MSLLLDRADAVKTLLEGLAELDGVTVLVDRQLDLETEVSMALGKSSGSLVTILWVGFRNDDQDKKGPRVEARYSVSLWTVPIVHGAGVEPADQLVQAIAQALHHWNPGAATTEKHYRARVAACEMVPDRNYLRYDIDLRLTVQL